MHEISNKFVTFAVAVNGKYLQNGIFTSDDYEDPVFCRSLTIEVCNNLVESDDNGDIFISLCNASGFPVTIPGYPGVTMAFIEVTKCTS